MGEQRFLSDTEWNESCQQAAAERNRPLSCCCQNGGEPFEMDGVMVVARNAGCIVHRPARRVRIGDPPS